MKNFLVFALIAIILCSLLVASADAKKKKEGKKVLCKEQELSCKNFSAYYCEGKGKKCRAKALSVCRKATSARRHPTRKLLEECGCAKEAAKKCGAGENAKECIKTHTIHCEKKCVAKRLSHNKLVKRHHEFIEKIIKVVCEEEDRECGKRITEHCVTLIRRARKDHKKSHKKFILTLVEKICKGHGEECHKKVQDHCDTIVRNVKKHHEKKHHEKRASCRVVAQKACKGEEKCVRHAVKICKSNRKLHRKIKKTDCVGRAIKKCGLTSEDKAVDCRFDYISKCHKKHHIKLNHKSFKHIRRLVLEKCDCTLVAAKKCVSNGYSEECFQQEYIECANQCNIRRKDLKLKLKSHIAEPSTCESRAEDHCGKHHECVARFIVDCQSDELLERTKISKLLSDCTGPEFHP